MYRANMGHLSEIFCCVIGGGRRGVGNFILPFYTTNIFSKIQNERR